MKQQDTIIVFTGPESTGKTFLAQLICEKTGLPLLLEQSRWYLEQYGPNYTPSDIIEIAQLHVQKENNLLQNHNAFVLDTDLITLHIWMKEVFNQSNVFISSHIKNYDKNRIYLLCKPDIPWESDHLRENPNDRHRLFTIYEDFLIQNKLEYKIIEGDYNSRIKSTLTFINELSSIKNSFS